MLITVNKYFTIIITKTWYNRYKEIIQITGVPPLLLHRMPDSKAGRRKVKWSDVTWARNTERVPFSSPFFFALSSMIPLSSNHRNHLHLVMVLLDQTDMSECQSGCKYSDIVTFCLGIILIYMLLNGSSGTTVGFKRHRQLGASGLCLASKWR